MEALTIDGNCVDNLLDVKLKEHVVEEIMYEFDRFFKLDDRRFLGGGSRLLDRAAHLVSRNGAKSQRLNDSFLLQIVYEDVLHRTLLTRVLEEVLLVVALIVDHTLAFHVNDKLQPGPPLDQNQSVYSFVVLDLSPEETEYERFHPRLVPRLKVQSLLLLLKMDELEHEQPQWLCH